MAILIDEATGNVITADDFSTLRISDAAKQTVKDLFEFEERAPTSDPSRLHGAILGVSVLLLNQGKPFEAVELMMPIQAARVQVNETH
ncbi:MAG: hypothetical protein ABW094_15400 [Candidatus Thiodiazotropha sp.]